MKKVAILSGLVFSFMVLLSPVLLSLVPEFYINSQFSGSIVPFKKAGGVLFLYLIALFGGSVLLSVSLVFVVFRTRRGSLERITIFFGHTAILLALFAFWINAFREDRVNYHMISEEGEKVLGMRMRLLEVEPIAGPRGIIKNVRVRVSIDDSIHKTLSYGSPIVLGNTFISLVDFGFITSGVVVEASGKKKVVHIGETDEIEGHTIKLISLESVNGRDIALFEVDGKRVCLSKGGKISGVGIEYLGSERILAVVLQSRRSCSLTLYKASMVMLLLSLFLLLFLTLKGQGEKISQFQ